MTALIGIRTNKWGEEQERLYAQLLPAFGDRIVIAFHNRPAGLKLPAPVVDIDDGWVRKNGLPMAHDWGWRCGDYALYAMREARPDAAFYWLIEPDVFFTGNAAGFFGRFEDEKADALGLRLGPFERDIRFAQALAGLPVSRAIFALVRFSGRAIDTVLEERRRAAKAETPEGTFIPNDELFVFSHLAARKDMVLGRLEDRAGDWFEGVQFDTNPDLLVDLVAREAPAGKVLHPVRNKAALIAGLAARLGGASGVLRAHRDFLRVLSEEEVDDLVGLVADHLQDGIARFRSSPAERRKQRRERRKA